MQFGLYIGKGRRSSILVLMGREESEDSGSFVILEQVYEESKNCPGD